MGESLARSPTWLWLEATRQRNAFTACLRESRQSDIQLESAQRGTVDITEWLVWFLACLDRAIDGANEKLTSVLRKARVWERINQSPVNARQRKVINRMLDDFKGHLTTSKYAKLTKCSNDTALRDIRALLARGIVEQNAGGGRSTSYRLSVPHKEDSA